jgi:hypothetical protein
MSGALAVAGVTAVLRGMLESWLGDQNANAALGGANAGVTAVAPDTIELTGANAAPGLNLFLHHVTPNQGWRNVDLPSADGRGSRTSSPPLALDLHYLLTAYGPAELQAEVLLGYGMQFLHLVPVLDRAEIEARLPLPLRESLLGRQVEMIKITPEPMGTEELSKLWTALQAHYRPSAAYHVSVVLIETTSETRVARPVLSRGPVDPVTNRERGIVAVPGTRPALPAISAVRPPNKQLGATLGQVVEVDGSNLAGTNRQVVLENRLLGVERTANAAPGTGADLVRFTVPNAPTQLPVGTYALRIRVTAPGEAAPRESNLLSLTVLPQLTSATSPVTPNGQGIATITAQVRPSVRPFQRASLLLGSREIVAEPRTTPTATLTFVVPDAVPDTYLAVLRVDGIDSVMVDRAAVPPQFVGTTVVIQ